MPTKPRTIDKTPRHPSSRRHPRTRSDSLSPKKRPSFAPCCSPTSCRWSRLFRRIHYQPRRPRPSSTLPTPSLHPLLSLVIRKLTDYYPLYSSSTKHSSSSPVRLSPSSTSLLSAKSSLATSDSAVGLAGGVLTTESLYAWFGRVSRVRSSSCSSASKGWRAERRTYPCLQHRGGREAITDHATRRWRRGWDDGENMVRRAQEHEFRIGCVGFGDSLGILAASLISMPLQVGLCNAHVRGGRGLCKQT